MKTISQENHRGTISLQQGDFLLVCLESIPSSGYIWVEQVVEGAMKTHEWTHSIEEYGRCIQLFCYRVAKRGKIYLVKYRPWLPVSIEDPTFHVYIKLQTGSDV